MTDTEQKRIKAICDLAHIENIGELSDGYHTYNQLYYQRMILFATIVKQNKDKAWKSLRHEDGELCFGGGWFIVGIDTPKGSYTYHCEDNFFSLFDCVELERAKHWDGHTEEDVTRLLSLEQVSCEDAVSRQAVLDINGSHHGQMPNHINHQIWQEIKDLSPVNPQPKTGHWIPLGNYDDFGNESSYKCSECGDLDTYPDNFCPNCGAKMVEP